MDSLAATIRARREAGEESYTFRLLNGKLDTLLKKLVEEAHETALAAKDAEVSAYFAREAVALQASEEQQAVLSAALDADLDHLLVLLEHCGIPLDEFAAELNTRMTEDEISLRTGVALLRPECVNRGR